jgi:hypothetical protein
MIDLAGRFHFLQVAPQEIEELTGHFGIFIMEAVSTRVETEIAMLECDGVTASSLLRLKYLEWQLVFAGKITSA